MHLCSIESVDDIFGYHNNIFYQDLQNSSITSLVSIVFVLFVCLSVQGADDVYGLEYGMYSTSGWLAGEMFVGAGANATLFTQPHGPCMRNITRYFGVCRNIYSTTCQLFIIILCCFHYSVC